MKRKLLLLFISFFFYMNSNFAQTTPYDFEVGLLAGTSFYHGDLVDQPFDQIGEINPSLGLQFRFNYMNIFAARANLVYGSLSGNDQNSANINRRKRNLSFRSPMFEFSLLPEFNIYTFTFKKSGYKITPAIFAGAGVFWFNPQAYHEGEWVDLQPLGTEGQGLAGNPSRYNRFSLSVPYGLLIKFQLSETTTIGWEFGYRYTTTDYIDDVGGVYPDMDVLAQGNGLKAVALSDRESEFTGLPSTRVAGDIRSSSASNDYYIISGFSVTVKLGKKTSVDQ